MPSEVVFPIALLHRKLGVGVIFAEPLFGLPRRVALGICHQREGSTARYV